MGNEDPLFGGRMSRNHTRNLFASLANNEQQKQAKPSQSAENTGAAGKKRVSFGRRVTVMGGGAGTSTSSYMRVPSPTPSPLPPEFFNDTRSIFASLKPVDPPNDHEEGLLEADNATKVIQNSIFTEKPVIGLNESMEKMELDDNGEEESEYESVSNRSDHEDNSIDTDVSAEHFGSPTLHLTLSSNEDGRDSQNNADGTFVLEKPNQPQNEEDRTEGPIGDVSISSNSISDSLDSSAETTCVPSTPTNMLPVDTADLDRSHYAQQQNTYTIGPIASQSVAQGQSHTAMLLDDITLHAGEGGSMLFDISSPALYAPIGTAKSNSNASKGEQPEFQFKTPQLMDFGAVRPSPVPINISSPAIAPATPSMTSRVNASFNASKLEQIKLQLRHGRRSQTNMSSASSMTGTGKSTTPVTGAGLSTSTATSNNESRLAVSFSEEEWAEREEKYFAAREKYAAKQKLFYEQEEAKLTAIGAAMARLVDARQWLKQMKQQFNEGLAEL